MSFSLENGYLPPDIQTILDSIMAGINTQFQTSYTSETFVGSNHYKFSYALAQRIQSGEVKTSEIFLYLLQYIVETNLKISRPVNTPPGIIEKFATEGWIASVKPMIEADAGKISICVDADEGERATGNFTVTSYANLVSGADDSVTVGATVFTAQTGAATLGTGTFQAATTNAATATSLAAQINAHATAGALVKAVASGAIVLITARHGGLAGNSIALAYTDNDTNVGITKSGTSLADGTDPDDYNAEREAICQIISEDVVGGVFSQGTEAETIVISNGQAFEYKFFLPDRIATKLRLTITTSENNQVVIGSPDSIKVKLLANINAQYALGRNFEPQRYYSIVDAPWASQVLLEYSLNGGVTWSSAVYDSLFTDLFEFGLADITLVEV